MRLIIVIFILLVTLQSGYCCSCGGPSTFCETLNDANDSINWDFVGREKRDFVSGVVLSKVLHGMDVKILRSYYNQIETDTVRIWGGNGYICRPSNTGFLIGDTLILNMAVIDSSSFFTFSLGGAELGEKVGDYELTTCGVKYLKVRNNMGIGHISPGVEEMDLNTFESLIMQDQFRDCLILKIDEEDSDTHLTLFPNPVNMQLKIRSSQIIENIKIHNSSGKIFYDQDNLGKTVLELKTQNFASGLYFLKIQYQDGKYMVKKFFKS